MFSFLITFDYETGKKHTWKKICYDFGKIWAANHEETETKKAKIFSERNTNIALFFFGRIE